MNRRTASLAFIFITLLVDILGFGLIIPVLPRLVTELAGRDPVTGSRTFGLLLSSFGLMQFLFSPFLGSLSDRFGRRPVLLLSLLFTSLDYVIMALAPNISWLFVGRILSGITSASFTVASAYIADVSPPEKRAQSYGIIGAAFGVGFVLGPAAGGILGGISARLPFWAAAGLAIINFLYGAFVLPESLSEDSRRKLDVHSLNPVKGLGILARYPWVFLFAGSLLLMGLAQSALQSVWVLYTTYKFNFTPTENGLSLALIGVMAILVQVVALPRVLKALGDPRTVLLGFMFNIIGFVGIAASTTGPMLMLVLIVWSLNGISGPTIQGILSKQFESNEQGAVQGALTSLQSITSIVGPIAATFLFALFTSRTTSLSLPGAPFYMGAVFITIATVIAVKALKTRSQMLRQ